MVVSATWQDERKSLIRMSDVCPDVFNMHYAIAATWQMMHKVTQTRTDLCSTAKKPVIFDDPARFSIAGDGELLLESVQQFGPEVLRGSMKPAAPQPPQKS